MGKELFTRSNIALCATVALCLIQRQAIATSVAITPLDVVRHGGDICFLANNNGRDVHVEARVTDAYVIGDWPHSGFSQIHKRVSATLTSGLNNCLTYSALFGSSMFYDLNLGRPYEVEIDTRAAGIYRAHLCLVLDARTGFTVTKPDLLKMACPISP